MSARSTLNSIKSIISEGLINNEISHKDLWQLLIMKGNYLELNQSIKMMRVKKVILKKFILLKNVKM